MKRRLDIVSFEEARRRRPSIARAERSLFLTPSALETILMTVGARPAETGAKLFGPSTRSGVDRVEFDEGGSARAGAAVYAPDTGWSDERIAFWLAQEDAEMRLWTGDVHSHPGGMGFPSLAAGPGLGDLGYAAEVLASVEWMDEFFLPILTNTDSDHPRLWPWVVTRDQPDVAQYAGVHVCPVADFPVRSFNPLWEQALDVHTPNAESELPQVESFVHLMSLDLTAVAVQARTEIRASPSGVVFSRGDVEVSLALPDGFPQRAPEVHVRGRVGERVFPFAWRPEHPHRADLRLKRLVRAALTFGSQEF